MSSWGYGHIGGMPTSFLCLAPPRPPIDLLWVELIVGVGSSNTVFTQPENKNANIWLWSQQKAKLFYPDPNPHRALYRYRRTGFYCEVKLLRTEVCRGLCESNCCDRPPDHYYYRLHDVFLANLIIAGYTGTCKLAIIGLPQ